MSSSLRRGALAAAALAFSIASLAACGAGNNAQTLEVKPDNAATTVGDIKIQNATVITQPEHDADGPGRRRRDALQQRHASAQTLDVDHARRHRRDGRSSRPPRAAAGRPSRPAARVVLGGKGNASAVLANGREAVQDGNVQPVTFTFSETGDVTLRRVRRPGRRATSRAAARARCRGRPARTPSGSARPRPGRPADVGRLRPSGRPPHGPTSRRRGQRDTATPTDDGLRVGAPARRPTEARGTARRLPGAGARTAPYAPWPGRFTARTCSPGRAPSPGSAARPGPARSWRAGA